MRFGDLPAYSSRNCLSNSIDSCSSCYFVQIQPISEKFNCDRRNDRQTDGPTNGPTDGRENTHLWRCENASKNDNSPDCYLQPQLFVLHSHDSGDGAREIPIRCDRVVFSRTGGDFHQGISSATLHRVPMIGERGGQPRGGRGGGG